MPSLCKMLMLLSGTLFLVPKLFWTIFSNDPRIDLGPESAEAVPCDAGGGGVDGEAEGFFMPRLLGGLTEGVRGVDTAAEVVLPPPLAKNLLRSAIEFIATAVDAMVLEAGGVDVFIMVGPTH